MRAMLPAFGLLSLFKLGHQLQEFVLAHKDAFELAGVLHRDVSIGNLLMVPQNGPGGVFTYHGVLTDWELSERIARRAEPDFVRAARTIVRPLLPPSLFQLHDT